MYPFPAHPSWKNIVSTRTCVHTQHLLGQKKMYTEITRHANICSKGGWRRTCIHSQDISCTKNVKKRIVGNANMNLFSAPPVKEKRDAKILSIHTSRRNHRPCDIPCGPLLWSGIVVAPLPTPLNLCKIHPHHPLYPASARPSSLLPRHLQ